MQSMWQETCELEKDVMRNALELFKFNFKLKHRRKLDNLAIFRFRLKPLSKRSHSRTDDVLTLRRCEVDSVSSTRLLRTPPRVDRKAMMPFRRN
eukprot:scaffold14119_cov428-Alexandrium_tamarense.AAC.16